MKPSHDQKQKLTNNSDRYGNIQFIRDRSVSYNATQILFPAFTLFKLISSIIIMLVLMFLNNQFLFITLDVRIISYNIASFVRSLYFLLVC